MKWFPRWVGGPQKPEMYSNTNNLRPGGRVMMLMMIYYYVNLPFLNKIFVKSMEFDDTVGNGGVRLHLA